jgi:hypothetical protein
MRITLLGNSTILFFLYMIFSELDISYGAVCDLGKYSSSFADPGCYTCPDNQFRSISVAYAPMKLTYGGNIFAYANQIFNGQPVYYCESTREYLWWAVSTWKYYAAETCCGNYGYDGAQWLKYLSHDPVEALNVVSYNFEWCVSCPPGTGLVCENGSYASVFCGSQTALCSPCAMGKYSSFSGMSFCSDCPPGTYGLNMSSVSLLSCQNCSSGTYSIKSGATTKSECASCTNY